MQQDKDLAPFTSQANKVVVMLDIYQSGDENALADYFDKNPDLKVFKEYLDSFNMYGQRKMPSIPGIANFLINIKEKSSKDSIPDIFKVKDSINKVDVKDKLVSYLMAKGELLLQLRSTPPQPGGEGTSRRSLLDTLSTLSSLSDAYNGIKDSVGAREAMNEAGKIFGLKGMLHPSGLDYGQAGMELWGTRNALSAEVFNLSIGGRSGITSIQESLFSKNAC